MKDYVCACSASFVEEQSILGMCNTVKSVYSAMQISNNYAKDFYNWPF